MTICIRRAQRARRARERKKKEKEKRGGAARSLSVPTLQSITIPITKEPKGNRKREGEGGEKGRKVCGHLVSPKVFWDAFTR